MLRSCFAWTVAVALMATVVAPSRGEDKAAQAPQAQRQGADKATARDRVKVLFLGDNGHHQPLVRLRQVYSDFARRGIDMSYTDRMEDLNPANLARFDALLVYSNITKITTEQESAVLDYVAQGHGFVPIHCASYCFLNSPKLTALTGGRFKSHGTGTFKELIVEASHPATKDLKPIESWDETYVHEMHNEKDRTVLGYRVDGDKKEPYTWVRTHGNGRVFYTAWGHDQRTWGNEDFLNLVERGIRWSSGDWALQPQPKPKPFEYGEAEIPNYPAGKQWGTVDEQLLRPMQKPVRPEDSMKHMAVPGGFKVELFATDPDIKKPISMAWDERGRLWIAETVDYPNEMQPQGQGNDRIVICEDSDKDGKADKFSVWAEKLSIPTSICFANGGLVVAQAPHMLFLKDTDGDGKADERKILFTGWGTQDTHAGPSNLRYGFDGWIYGTVGYSAFRGEVGGERVSFGQGAFRFKPDGSKLEFLGSTNNNTWGLGLSEEGHIFGSTANGNPSWYVHIPNRYYEQVRGFAPRGLPPLADITRFFALSDKVRQVDFHGAYTAGAGAALYTARSFPQEYWNRISFVAEPTGHLLGKFVLVPVGSAFEGRNDFSLLSSTDEWTSPIIGEVGPDGAVWMVDWYNFIVQHNPIPRGFRGGKGGAYETPLRDKTHGRIYRIIYSAGAPSQTYDLSKANASQLVEALKSENQLWRMHAQRLVVEKGDKGVAGGLVQLVKDTSVDAIGLNTAAIHALWALHGLGVVGDGPVMAAVVEALRHPSPGVRKAAVEVLPATEQSAKAILEAKAIEDAHPQVRKSALLALSQMPLSEEGGAAVFKILSGRGIADDRWLPDAAAIAAAKHDSAFLKAAFAAYKSDGAQPAKVDRSNRIANASFEEGAGDNLQGWRPRTYSGQASHAWVDGGRTGRKAVKITSEAGADSSFFIDVPVEPDTDYKLSAWIKTDGLQRLNRAYGALLNVHTTRYRTPGVSGDSDWKQVEVVFNSGSAKMVSINCLFGGYGLARGVAYFDDIEMVPVSSASLPGAMGKVVRIVANHYAQRGPDESIVQTLSALRTSDPLLSAVVLDGLAQGWPAGKGPNFTEEQLGEIRAVMTALPADLRDRMLVLADRWGRRDLFAAEFAKMAGEFKATVADAKKDPTARIEAARRLIGIADNAQSVNIVLKEVRAQATPELTQGLINALENSADAKTGAAIIGKWQVMTPSAQRAAVAMVLRKSEWTGALLDAVAAGNINAKDLLTQDWQTLTRSRDQEVRMRARELEKSAGRAPNPDKQKLLATLLPVAEKKGDVVRGKEVYVKNCQVCHLIEGTGGGVGPDLTGIGLRPKSELLMEIIDPNRSVEGTYRSWLVETRNEDISGRLLSESQAAVEIIDAQGQKHVVQRNAIRKIIASELSVMPEGFESLSQEELADLLEFLAASKVKH